MNTLSSTLYAIFEWISRLALLQILWIFSTLLGGIFFGFFPATLAVFAIVRRWIKGDTEIPILKSFWNFYKVEFFKANKLGIVISIITIIFISDYQFLQQTEMAWFHYPIFASFIIFCLFLLYIFPAFVHYQLGTFKLIKNAFLIMLINPIITFYMIICITSLIIFYWYIPAIFFIFGISGYAFITMWLSNHAFQKIQKSNTTPTN